MMDNKDLLTCPFCSYSTEHLCLEENTRNDKIKRDKNGKRMNHIDISHHIECTGCGATGPQSFFMLDDETLTEQHISDSVEMATLAWNKREPINNKAFELVNKLITSAFEKI